MSQRFAANGHGPSSLHRSAPAGGRDQGIDVSAHMAAASSSMVLLAFFITLMVIPGSFSIAGINLTLYKLILLALFVPLSLRWLSGQEGPVTTVDILILAHIIWAGIAILIVHGTSRMFFVAASSTTTFGSYLIGRMMVRSAMDFRMFFKYFMIGLVLVAPFALIEFLTNKNLLTVIFGKVFSISGNETAAGGRRLGFIRARGAFEHPILLGLFSGIGLGSVVYVFRESILRQWAAGLFVVFMVFTSISTGPFIGVAVQLLLIIWDRSLRFISRRWLILAVLVALGTLFLVFGSQLDIKEFVLNNLALDVHSAAGRFDILRYGLLEIARQPFFGIGFNEWTRPFWKSASFDSYWLGVAMRYGLPTLLFLLGGIGWSCMRIMARTGLTETEKAYRTGYLISMAGVLVVLASVHIWGATEIFIMTFIGAGSWFYTSPEITERAEAERRRRMRGPGGRHLAPVTAPTPSMPSAPRPAAAPGNHRPVRTRPATGPTRRGLHGTGAISGTRTPE